MFMVVFCLQPIAFSVFIFSLLFYSHKLCKSSAVTNSAFTLEIRPVMKSLWNGNIVDFDSNQIMIRDKSE